MKFEINKERIRRWRLRLARFAAPAGVDIHDPDTTPCPIDQDILEAACFGRLEADHNGNIRMDVARYVIDAVHAGLLGRHAEDGVYWWELTPAGEKELARLWGDRRVPPWSRIRHGQCASHGEYDRHPGDLKGCPSCATERAIRRINTEPASWLARRRERAAGNRL